MKLSKTWTTVTPLSKTIAMILFIALPFIGFYVGYNFPHSNNLLTNKSALAPQPLSTTTLNTQIMTINHKAQKRTIS